MAKSKDTPQQETPDPMKRGLNEEEVTMVRRALLVGLESYGEIQRLQNAVELCKMAGESVPKQMKPFDPTGSADTICDFAEALLVMGKI